MILAIETSDILCSIAFRYEERTLLEYNLELPLQHATILGQIIEQGLAFLRNVDKLQKFNKENIRLVVIALGPGSFTGLRIGLSFAQGFCLGQNIPLVGISNHQILSLQRSLKEEPVYTAIEARRGEVYLARHRFTGGLLSELERHQVVAKEQLASEIEAHGQLIVHHSLHLDKETVELLEQKNVLLHAKADYPAHYLAILGDEKFKTAGADDPENIEPLYIRPFAGVL